MGKVINFNQLKRMQERLKNREDNKDHTYKFYLRGSQIGFELGGQIKEKLVGSQKLYRHSEEIGLLLQGIADGIDDAIRGRSN